MTLFMPPIQRKKKVEEKYNPDSFRVISEDAVSDHPKYRPLPYRASFEPRTPTPKVMQRSNTVGQLESHREYVTESLRPLKNTRVLPQLLPDYRAHNPQPRACGFLDRNVRFLNEPICNVYTAPVQHEEGRWWPTRANPGQLQTPPFTEETHYRIDYNCQHGDRPRGSGRHTANTDREPALGTVPVNFLRERDGSQRLYKEGLSYEHMYNCRNDPNYPIRGKRHGAFVWSRMDPISQKKFIEYYSRLEEEERQAIQAGQEGPLSACEKGSAPVIRSSNHKTPSVPTSPKRKSSTCSVQGGKVTSRNSVRINENANNVSADVSEPKSPPAVPAPPATDLAPSAEAAPAEVAVVPTEQSFQSTSDNLPIVNGET